jgi:hypothetical protein
LWTIVNSQCTDEDADRALAAKEVTAGLSRSPERDLEQRLEAGTREPPAARAGGHSLPYTKSGPGEPITSA